MPEGTEHWSSSFEHESLAAPETRESFSKAMSKYNTKEEAILGGYNAMKQVGTPFRLPESLDKLPDDKVRGEFKSQASKLLGISGVEKLEDLADLDIKAGLKPDHEINEEFVNSFKQFAVERKLPKQTAQELVGFHNQALSAAMDKIETAKIEAATKTNEALIAHFKNKEEVAKQSELVRRAVQNWPGMTTEKYERIGNAIADSILTKDPDAAIVFTEMISKYALEGNTEVGTGGSKTTETAYERNKRLYPSSPSMWGSPDK